MTPLAAARQSVPFAHGTFQLVDGLRLDAAMSASIFERLGVIQQLDMFYEFESQHLMTEVTVITVRFGRAELPRSIPRVWHPPKYAAGARGERAWWPLPFQRQASNLGGMNNEWLKRITVEEGKCGGRPCIRGLRIRVSDVLELLAAGASFQEILSDYPSLEREDIIAAIEYAAHQTDHAVLQAL